jgi:hypothetical protein
MSRIIAFIHLTLFTDGGLSAKLRLVDSKRTSGRAA